MKILILLLLLVLGGGMLLLAILRSIGQLLFGRPTGQSQRYGKKTNNTNDNRNDYNQASQSQKKVFDKNEGEYVKYEEVKD